MSYILIIIVISFIILVHEIGHFVMAKLTGIPVKTFSVGFGPKMVSRTKNGTEYRLSWIPVGGFVLPDIEDEITYFEIPAWKRILLALGGPAANILLSILLLAIVSLTQNGFSLSNIFIKPIIGVFKFIGMIFAAIPTLFSDSENLSGVIGIVSMGDKIVSHGWLNLVNFSILININLAVLNLLPIPALDGGKVLMHLLEYIHPKAHKLQTPLALAGWLLLIGLLLYTTVIDVIRLVN